MIELKNVCKHYKVAKRSSGLSEAVKSLFRREYTSIQALDNISFTVRDGEAVGGMAAVGCTGGTTGFGRVCGRGPLLAPSLR